MNTFAPQTVTAVIAVLIISVPLFPAPAAASDAERLEKLERAVEQLQERNTQLEKEVRSLKKELASSPTAPAGGPAVDADGNRKAAVTYDGKTYIEKSAPVTEEKKSIFAGARGSEIKLTLGGFIQVNFEGGDVQAFEGRFGSQDLKDRFRLRRARINMTGEYAEQFDFKIEGDFALSDGLSSNRLGFEATDIFANWHAYPEAQIKIGQYKAPFGLEQLTPDTLLYVIERSLPTGALTPERQIGIQVWGKPFTNLWPEQKDLLAYYAGVFNGDGRNVSVNDNNSFMYVGRVELMPFKGKIFGHDSSLKLGADGLDSLDDAGTNISPALTLKVNSDGSLSSFNLPTAGERTAWSVDAWLKLGPFDLIAEYLEEYVNSRTVDGISPAFADFTASGFYVEGGYFIIPKKLQAVVQWQQFNPGQRAFDGIQSITGGLNYYLHGDDIKFMVNYIHTWSDFRDAHPEVGDDNFDEVIARVQVIF